VKRIYNADTNWQVDFFEFNAAYSPRVNE